jgi:hypothetical protein
MTHHLLRGKTRYELAWLDEDVVSWFDSKMALARRRSHQRSVLVRNWNAYGSLNSENSPVYDRTLIFDTDQNPALNSQSFIMSSEEKQNAALGSTILRVYNYEPGTKSTRQKKSLELPSDQNLTKIFLEFIRGLLVEKRVFDSPEYGPCHPLHSRHCVNLPFIKCESAILQHRWC